MACPCCQSHLHKSGEDVSGGLDVIPAISRTADGPSQVWCSCTNDCGPGEDVPYLITSGMASIELVTHVVVSKFAWYPPPPLYRR